MEVAAMPDTTIKKVEAGSSPGEMGQRYLVAGKRVGEPHHEGSELKVFWSNRCTGSGLQGGAGQWLNLREGAAASRFPFRAG
jgi:hypothetical protein